MVLRCLCARPTGVALVAGLSLPMLKRTLIIPDVSCRQRCLCARWPLVDGEPYASLQGRDMNGVVVGPLRLWRFSVADAHSNNIYIIRGLKVILERYWCNQSWEYKPVTNGSKRLESNYRTALEDVTCIDSIAKMFQ